MRSAARLISHRQGALRIELRVEQPPGLGAHSAQRTLGSAPMTRAPRRPVFGAVPGAEGVSFRLWAPAASRADLHLRRASGGVCTVPMRRCAGSHGDGGWTAAVADAAAGDRYALSIDGGEPRPDPAARFLP